MRKNRYAIALVTVAVGGCHLDASASAYDGDGGLEWAESGEMALVGDAGQSEDDARAWLEALRSVDAASAPGDGDGDGVVALGDGDGDGDGTGDGDGDGDAPTPDCDLESGTMCRDSTLARGMFFCGFRDTTLGNVPPPCETDLDCALLTGSECMDPWGLGDWGCFKSCAR